MLGQLLGRQVCPEPDECFAETSPAENTTAPPVEPGCEEWGEGFKCDTTSFIGKLNWLFRSITCAIKSLKTQADNNTTRITILENARRLVDIRIEPTTNELIEVYSDGSTEVNDLTPYLDNIDTDSNTQLSNPSQVAGPGADEVTVTWQVIDVANGNAVIGTESVVIPVGGNTVDTNTFISAINGDTNGGNVGFNSARVLPIQRSDSQTWNVQLPPSSQILPVPRRILNVTQARSDGTFDSGNISINLNAVAGVTVPAGAVAAIVRCGSSVSGQDTPGLGVASLFAFGHIEVASTVAQLNGGNFFSPMSVVTQATYVDTNLIQSDNDDTAEVIVPLNGTSIAYRAKVRYNNNLGIDSGTARISIVGFIF